MTDAIKDQIKTHIMTITNCSKESINNDEEITNYDIDSMRAGELMLLIEENYKIKIPEEDYHKLLTVNQISDYINTTLNSRDSK